MSKFSDATFYLAPSGYKEGILFPQKPLSTNGEIAFTRAGSAWRTNIEGQVEETCYNLLQYSEDFNVTWSKSNATVTSNTTTAPDGNTTADTLTPDATNTTHRISYLGGNAGTLGYTLSVFAKSNGYNFLQIAGGVNVDHYGNFNLSTGVVTQTGLGTIASIANVGNGWYRCSITIPAISGANILIAVVNSGTSAWQEAFTANGTSGIFIWGAQLVQGSLPRPYLSTTTRQNFPRVDYSLGTGTFLLEPQRTNIHLLSTSMYNMVTFGATVPTLTRATTVLDPSAGYNAALVTGGSGSSGSFGIYNIIPTVVTSGQVVVVSCYVKAGTHDKVMLQHANVTITGGAQAYFDLATGTTPTSGASIQAVGNGWYRCIMQPVTFTADSNITTYNIGCYVTPSTSTNTWSSDFTGKSVYFYGIQVEVGSYATSLIPTSSSAATRIADSFSRGNIFTNNLISASGGTWFVELKNNLAYLRDGFGALYLGTQSLTTSTTGDGLYIRRNDLSSNRLSIQSYISGVATALYLTQTDTVKIAFKWNGTSVDVFVNGTKQVSASAFTPTAMEFLGHTTIVDVPKFIQQMALWRTPLTDAQCQELTL